MYGKGRYADNIFVERLWRKVKYEEVYLKAYAGARETRKELGTYFRFYNDQRPHQALGLSDAGRGVPPSARRSRREGNPHQGTFNTPGTVIIVRSSRTLS